MTNLSITADEELKAFGYKPELHRTLTTWGLTAFGLSYLQPIGPAVIFGFLLTASGGTVALPYLFAFVGMIFTILSYSALIKEYPLAGSVYSYVKFIAGPFFGFIAGWLLALDYILIPIITSVSAAIYAHQLIPVISYQAWLITFIFSMGLLNLIGIRSTTFFGSILLLIQVTIVLVSFVIWTLFITDSLKNFGALFSLKPLHFDSIKGLIQASSLAIFSFLGFDAVTTLAEETINPRKTIPRAMLICTCIGFFFMFFTGYLGVLIIPNWEKLISTESWLNATLFNVAKITGGDLFAMIYTVGFILAMMITNLVGTTAATRLLFGMGRDNAISKRVFGSVNQRWKTPHGCIFVIVLIEILLGSFANQEQLAELINYGAISGFIMLNFSVIVMGHKKAIKIKNSKGRYSFYFVAEFFISPAIALAIMLAIFISMKLPTLIFGTLWGSLGLFYYLHTQNRSSKL